MATLIILLRLIDIHSDHVLQFLNVILLYKFMVQPLQIFLGFFCLLASACSFIFLCIMLDVGLIWKKAPFSVLTCLCELIDA